MAGINLFLSLWLLIFPAVTHHKYSETNGYNVWVHYWQGHLWRWLLGTGIGKFGAAVSPDFTLAHTYCTSTPSIWTNVDIRRVGRVQDEASWQLLHNYISCVCLPLNTAYAANMNCCTSHSTPPAVQMSHPTANKRHPIFLNSTPQSRWRFSGYITPCSLIKVTDVSVSRR